MMNPKSKLLVGGCRLQVEAGGLHATLSLHSPAVLRQVTRKALTASTPRKYCLGSRAEMIAFFWLLFYRTSEVLIWFSKSFLFCFTSAFRSIKKN